jgi:hypothetical protein
MRICSFIERQVYSVIRNMANEHESHADYEIRHLDEGMREGHRQDSLSLSLTVDSREVGQRFELARTSSL